MSIKNSNPTTVDFNTEIQNVMSAAIKSEGMELKLAVAVYTLPEKFNIGNILNASNKSKAILDALAKHAPAFADRVSKLKALNEEKKKASTVRQSAIVFEIAEINRSMNAARSMLDRALQEAYWLKTRGAIIQKVDNKHISVTYTVPFVIGDGDNAKSITEDKLTRADLHRFGSNLLKHEGVIKSRDKKGNGSKPVSVKDKLKSVNTIADNMKVLSDVVGTLNGKAKDEFVSDPNSEGLLVTLMHSFFAHEGVVAVDDIVNFLRSNVQGVRIDTSIKSRKAA